MAPGLVVALHGSPHPGAAAVASALESALGERLPGVPVRTAWVDSRVRTLESVAGPGDVIVPAFLTAGYHVASDIPDAARGARVTGHVGPRVAQAVAGRVREAGGPGDALLLAAAGSRRPEALAEVERAAAGLGRVFGVLVRVGYLYGGGIDVEAVAADLAVAGFRDVTVATFFVAPGRYTARLGRLPVARVAEPLGAHPVLVDAVADLYRDAARSPYLAGLDLRGRRVLVAGAGAVASRRVPELLAAGADVLVVAPDAAGEIAALAAAGRLSWQRRPVAVADVEGAWFVLAATSDASANALVAIAAEAGHTFCVRADCVEGGSARTPAIGHVAGVTVGVLSAQGRDPRRVAEARDAAVAAIDDWAAWPAEGAAS